FFFSVYLDHPHLHSFPTRRSSDLNYSGILTSSEFIRPLINSIGIGLIATFIAVVLASMAAYAVARLRFPGKGVLIGVSLLIAMRSEEHTSELQSLAYLVCRLLLEK